MSCEQGEGIDMASDREEDSCWEKELLHRIQLILAATGRAAACKGCGAPIVWVTHQNGKRAPYTPEGLNHFVDCPQAQQFRKKATCDSSGK